MRIALSTFLLSALLSAPAAAQACSDLTVTGDGTPGTTLTFDVTGSTPDTPTILLVGPNAGTTTIRLGPLGSFDLGLTAPIVPIPMGTADANGDVSLAIDLPPGSYPQVSLNGQSLALSFEIRQGPPRITACTSDVEAFQVGAGS